jgi:hypothetical protein
MTIKLQRRSKRLFLDVPLVIRGEAKDKSPFQEETFTVTVSAHGALVVLGTQVALGQTVLLANPKGRGEREGTVIFLGPPMRDWPQSASNSRIPRPSSGQSTHPLQTGICRHRRGTPQCASLIPRPGLKAPNLAWTVR